MKFRVFPANVDTSLYLPNPEVVSTLMTSAVPREGKAFLLAASVETLLPGPNNGPLEWPYNWSQFRCLFGFKEWTGSLAAFPPWSGATVGGVQTHAAGVLQDEPETYAEIAALTGDSAFEPQDQCANNWVLAVRDFHSRTGGDLLSTLQAGNLAAVNRGLSATWPEGCDANFPTRYRQALSMFPVVPQPPPPPPPAPPPPEGGIVLRPGIEALIPLTAVDQDGQPFPLPADFLVSDDTKVCTVTVSPGDAVKQKANILGVAVGQTQVRGADLVIPVTVEASALAHIAADLSKVVLQRAAALSIVAATALMFAMPLPLFSDAPEPQPLVRVALPPATMTWPVLPRAEQPHVMIPEIDECFSPRFTSLWSIDQCLERHR